MISYGNLSDAQLLQIYGFVEEHEGYINPWNSVLIPANAVDQVIPSSFSLTTAEGAHTSLDFSMRSVHA